MNAPVDQTYLESILETIELVKTGKLDADPRFIETDIAELLFICNACGAKGSRLPIPQTAWGLNIRPMCHLHDFDYHMGHTIEAKDLADRRMRNNGHRLVEQNSIWFLYTPRCRRIQTYYLFVHNFGGTAFWDGKQR